MGFVKKPPFYIALSLLLILLFWTFQWRLEFGPVLAHHVVALHGLNVWFVLSLSLIALSLALKAWVRILNQQHLHPGWALLWALSPGVLISFVSAPDILWTQCFLIMALATAMRRKIFHFTGALAVATFFNPIYLVFYFLLGWVLFREVRYFSSERRRHRWIKRGILLIPLFSAAAGVLFAPSQSPAPSSTVLLLAIIPALLVLFYWMVHHLRAMNFRDLRFWASLGLVVVFAFSGGNYVGPSSLAFVFIPFLKQPEKVKKRYFFAVFTLLSFFLSFSVFLNQ